MEDASAPLSDRPRLPNAFGRLVQAFWPNNLTWGAIGTALLLAGLAMALRAAMQPLLDDRLSFALAFPAVAFIALRHGAVAAMVTIVACALWAAAGWLPPFIETSDMAVELGTFGVAAVVTALVCDHLGRPEALPTQPASSHETSLARWLRGVLWGAALIPLIAFAVAAGWGYQDAFSRAHAAALGAARVAAGQAEQTLADATKALERCRLLFGAPAAELAAREFELHERLQDLALGLHAATGLAVISAEGRLVASSAVHPVDRTLDYADREYFRQARRQPDSPVQVSEVITDRQTGQRVFTLSRARTRAGGVFDGVVVATLPLEPFLQFFQSLVPESTGNSFGLFRNDGAVLVRWPPPPDDATRIPADGRMLVELSRGQASGVMSVTSVFDAERRVVAFQRVSGLPLHAVAGLGVDSILASWFSFLQWLAAILLPVTLVLVYVAWLALQRVRGHHVTVLLLEAETQRRMQAEVALVQAQKLEALGQLTGGVAHDFNNLLGIISNSVYLLQRGLPQGTGSAPLAAIGRATASGVKLTRQLLSFARKQALKPELLRLQTWLPGVGDLLQTTLGSRIALEVVVDPQTACVSVDASELEIALINLAVNARHAMPEGGVLRVSAANAAGPSAGRAQPTVVIRVADNGVGIAPAHLGRVFEPFFTTKPAGAGSGLGLSQVYGLCMQSGGNAHVESVEGQGTTISLYFPAQAADAAEIGASAEAAASWLHACVLMVEDNEELATTQAAWLRNAGLTVEHVSRCDKALEILEHDSGRFDAVLSDVVTPGKLDGVDLALRLQTLCPSLPVLLMSGYNTRIDEARKAGIEVLEKPVAPESLLGRLTQLLTTRGAATPGRAAAAA